MAFKVDDLVLPTRYVFHQNRFVGVEMGPYYMTTAGLAALEQRKPRFETLNAAFVEKYGAPSRTRRVRYRGMEEIPRSQSSGSEFVPTQFSEEVHLWENDSVRIEIARWRDVNINRASIETAEWYRMKKAFDEAKKKGSVTNF